MHTTQWGKGGGTQNFYIKYTFDSGNYEIFKFLFLLVNFAHTMSL